MNFEQLLKLTNTSLQKSLGIQSEHDYNIGADSEREQRKLATEKTSQHRTSDNVVITYALLLYFAMGFRKLVLGLGGPGEGGPFVKAVSTNIRWNQIVNCEIA